MGTCFSSTKLNELLMLKNNLKLRIILGMEMKLILLTIILFAMAVPGKSTCPLIGVAYSGDWLVGIDNVETWESCGTICHNLNHPGTCENWTYFPNSGDCQLEGSGAHISESDEAISGDMDCYSSVE